MAVSLRVLKEIKVYEKTLITAFVKNKVIVCFNTDSKNMKAILVLLERYST